MNQKPETKKFSESTLTLTNRAHLSISGVEKVNSVSEVNINLNVSGSTLIITGSGLQVLKLDVDGGLLKVSGLIDSIRYNQKKESLLKRVFK